MSAYRTKAGWKKRSLILKPDAVPSGILTSGEPIYSKDQTQYRWEVPHTEEKPDSWYLGDDEQYI